MKKNLLLSAAIIALLSFQTIQMQAQDYKYSLGGGVTYLPDSEHFGVYGKGIYHFTPKWEAALTGIYYTTAAEGVTLFDIDADIHYLFYNNEENLTAYILAGLKRSSRITEYGSDAGIDLNLGAGLRYKLSERLSINPTVKYILGSGGYLELSAGLSYSF